MPFKVGGKAGRFGGAMMLDNGLFRLSIIYFN